MLVQAIIQLRTFLMWKCDCTWNFMWSTSGTRIWSCLLVICINGIMNDTELNAMFNRTYKWKIVIHKNVQTPNLTLNKMFHVQISVGKIETKPHNALSFFSPVPIAVVPNYFGFLEDSWVIYLFHLFHWFNFNPK